MRARVVGLVGLFAAATQAGADTGDRRPLGEGYTLVVDHWSVYVTKGTQRARVAPGNYIHDVKIDKAARKVWVTIDNNDCAGPDAYTWTYAQLDARMENTAAYLLHKKKDFAGAAAGFAKAVAADPAWTIPAYNLASARQLLGDKAGAIQALAPWIASAPVQTYLQVTFDPELSPLLGQPELGALRAAKPGTATIDVDGELTGTVAYAKERGLVAVIRSEQSWGACAYTNELELRDGKTGALVAHVPTVQWSETDAECQSAGRAVLPRARGLVAARAKAFTRMLRDLGFEAVKLEKGVSGPETAKGARTFSFKKAKLGLAASSRTARLLAKDTVLGQVAVLDLAEQAVLVEEPRMAVIWSVTPIAEGCGGTDPSDVSLLPYARP